MNDASRPTDYLIVHQDWYELPKETDPLLRDARVSTLNPQAFAPGGGAQVIKHAYEVLEVAESIPAQFTIGECRPVGEPHYDTLEAAQDVVRGLGVSHPKVGFNPVD